MPFAEPIPGKSTEALQKIAMEEKIHVICGTISEKTDERKAYNTCTVWGPTGQLEATYRKVINITTDRNKCFIKS